jgi:protein-S-isoprenylcysteine O-methyltransferase Ste14
VLNAERSLLSPPRTGRIAVMLLLKTLGWFVCVVYATIPSFWLTIHPRVDYWRGRLRSPYRILLPLWIGMWIVLGLATLPWREVALYSTQWTWVPALALFGCGFWIYSQAVKNFSGAQLGGVPEVLPGHKEHQLVTSGIRARVRHPVYLGHLCEMVAWSFGTGLAVLYALTAFAVFTGAIMIRLEDAELERRFGEEYRKYRSAVPAVIPRVFVRW